MERNVKKLIQNHIKEVVYSKYEKIGKVDKSHGTKHLSRVIDNSVKFTEELIKNGEKVDPLLVMIIAAYHDIGLYARNYKINDSIERQTHVRDNHEKYSVGILKADYVITSLLSEEELQICCDAITRHRTINKKDRVTIYDKILADADISTSPSDAIIRLWEHRQVPGNTNHEGKLYSEMNTNELINDLLYFTNNIFFTENGKGFGFSLNLKSQENLLKFLEKRITDKNFVKRVLGSKNLI